MLAQHFYTITTHPLSFFKWSRNKVLLYFSWRDTLFQRISVVILCCSVTWQFASRWSGGLSITQISTFSVNFKLLQQNLVFSLWSRQHWWWWQRCWHEMMTVTTTLMIFNEEIQSLSKTPWSLNKVSLQPFSLQYSCLQDLCCWASNNKPILTAAL